MSTDAIVWCEYIAAPAWYRQASGQQLQQKWKTGIEHFARVRYEQVYSGIDLISYDNQRSLEYDFIVAADAEFDSSFSGLLPAISGYHGIS